MSQEHIDRDRQVEDYYTRLEDYYTRPWSEYRGIYSTDRNFRSLLVRAPLDELSNALAQRAIETQRDVLGREILLDPNSIPVLAFQIVGQDWSVVSLPRVRSEFDSRSEIAKLSAQLQQPIIDHDNSDVGMWSSSDLYESGELVEYYEFQSGLEDEANNAGELQVQRYLLCYNAKDELERIIHSDDADEELIARYTPKEEEEEDEEDDESHIETVFAWSRYRQITAGNFSDSDIESLLKKYDAFDPSLTIENFIGRRQNDKQRYRVKNPSFIVVTVTPANSRREITSAPELVRVDFFKFER